MDKNFNKKQNTYISEEEKTLNWDEIQNSFKKSFGAEIFKSKILDELYEKKLNERFKEHVTLYLYKDKKYKTKCINSSNGNRKLIEYGRFDLDTKSDLEKLDSFAKNILITDSFIKIINKFKKIKKLN